MNAIKCGYQWLSPHDFSRHDLSKHCLSTHARSTIIATSLRTPTITQLKAFATVAEHLHFRDSAAVLGMSQPALSGAIAALEENLGTQLVERTTRKVLLTPSGERVARHAQRVLAAMDDLVEEAAAARKPFTGTVKIGVIPTLAPYLLPALLRPLKKRFPDLELFVHEEQTAVLLEGISSGRLDLGLLALPAGAAGVEELPLYDEDFLLVAPEHTLPPGGGPVPRAVLKDHEILLLEEGHCLRDQALDVCSEAGAGAGGTRAASLSTLVQLVAGGIGVTLLPETAVAVDARPGSGLEARRFAGVAPSRRIGLAYRSSSARAEEFAGLAAAMREAVTAAGLPVRLFDAERSSRREETPVGMKRGS
ncbi:LysR substrate-binding domain-containing protein [Catenulispora yoronensis]|uniref:Probable hydrogen peroxide-inducible genes activator n=1 Tax=Catenulispora yoronensis TaxID=450799 RepID=A0ABN2V3L2_9ACTN